MLAKEKEENVKWEGGGGGGGGGGGAYLLLVRFAAFRIGLRAVEDALAVYI